MNSVKRIDNQVFKKPFRRLQNIFLYAVNFKKLIHNHGIEWIRSLNYWIDVNVSDPEEYGKNKGKITYICILFIWGYTFEDVLPDTDFCLWKNFPFAQMVETNIIVKYGKKYTIDMKILKLTCLYYWLNQYYYKYNNETNEKAELCDYDAYLRRCNRTDFHSSFVWDVYDTKSLSKGVQIFLTVSSYFISLFGLITNSILIYLIWSKSTRDIFKDLKHFKYLGMISICNIIIFVIYILSWISDCKQTIQLFCPETRRFIVIQFFKVSRLYSHLNDIFQLVIISKRFQ